MTFRIPSADKRLSQPNNSDVHGNLYQTRNIDLDEEGYIKLASGTVSLYSETDHATFKNLTSIFKSGGETCLVGNYSFAVNNFNLDKTRFERLVQGNSPGNDQGYGDGIDFSDDRIITDNDDDNIKKEDGVDPWIDIVVVDLTPSPFALCEFPAQNSLLAARDNVVKRLDTSLTVQQTLTLPDSYRVTGIQCNGNYAYITTANEEGGYACLFLWTGINTTNDGAYSIPSISLQTIVKYKSTVAVVDSAGRILVFDGGGFVEIAKLPGTTADVFWGDSGDEYQFIRYRGADAERDRIYLNISNQIESVNRRYLHNMLGEVYKFDDKVGAYQIYSTTNTEVLADKNVDASAINTTTDVITVSGITVPTTGNVVLYRNGGTNIGGLLDNHFYYVIKVTSTTFKVAETYEDAINETAIDLTSTSSDNEFYFIKQNDYGQGVSAWPGAIKVLDEGDVDSRILKRVVFTTKSLSSTGTEHNKVCGVCPKINNLGYIISPKMFSDNTEDMFASAVLRFKPLKYEDKITVKYRTEDRLGLPAMPRSITDADNLCTWTSSTTFTTPSSPTQDYYDFSTVEIGDEVEIIGGASSGFIAHVASISKSGFQYTVTIDTASPFYASGDKSVVKIDNWKVAEVIDGATFNGTQKTVSIDTNAGWAQFKIVLEGTDVTLYDNVFTSKKFEGGR